MRGCVEHLNPDGLHKNPAYSQAVVATGDVQTVYVGDQNAVDTAGNVVGRDDIKVQAEQIFVNLETALAAAGARLDHVVKWNIYVVQGQPPRAASSKHPEDSQVGASTTLRVYDHVVAALSYPRIIEPVRDVGLEVEGVALL